VPFSSAFANVLRIVSCALRTKANRLMLKETFVMATDWRVVGEGEDVSRVSGWLTLLSAFWRKKGVVH
jgi:hypothetical protein